MQDDGQKASCIYYYLCIERGGGQYKKVNELSVYSEHAHLVTGIRKNWIVLK